LVHFLGKQKMNEVIYKVYSILLLLLVQKKEQEKDTRLSRPFGLSYASRCCRDLKKLATLKQFLSLFPPTALMLSVKEWVIEKR